jgi:hypothetical protein
MKNIITCIALLCIGSCFAQSGGGQSGGQSYNYEYSIRPQFYHDNVIRVYFGCHVNWSKILKNKANKDSVVTKDSTISADFFPISVVSHNTKLYCYIKQESQDTFSLTFDTTTNNAIAGIIKNKETASLKSKLGVSAVSISKIKLGQVFIVSPGYDKDQQVINPYARFVYKAVCISAVSLPFALEAYKFKLGYIKQSFASSEFQSQFLNAAIGINWKWGYLRYRKHLFSAVYQPNTIEFGGGLLAGLTSYNLDQNSLSFSDTSSNMQKKYGGTSIPVFRFGPSTFLSWHAVSLTFAMGLEYAVGGNAQLFKYQGQFWVGVGAGVQITQIFQSIQNSRWAENAFQ